jgi:hypothetical protein
MAMVMTPALAADDQPTSPSPAGRWEDLGAPVHRSRVYSQAVGRDATGREVLYLGFSDSKVFVLALDPRTGKGRQLDLLGKSGQVWGLCAHSNGKAYASIGTGSIFELDAAAGTVRLLGTAPKGEDVVWELWEASDGNLYGGTYPRAKLARVNVKTGAIEDLGRMDPEQMYVRTVAVQGDFVYCGCGVTKPSVWAYNIRTGEKTQLLPDEARNDKGWGRAFKRIDGNTYIYGAGESVYRVTGLSLEKVAKMPAPPFLELADRTRVLVYNESGPERKYWLVKPGVRKDEVHFDYTSSGTPLWDLIEGPDGRVYGNSASPITLFAFDPTTKQTQIYGDPVGHAGQIYSWMWRESKLHMAAYSECTYTIWNPARPWNFGTEPGNNPRRIGKTSRQVQRANGMIPAPDGKHVIVGGVPGYGRVGGGLVIVDPEAAKFDLIEKPVGDQSPWTLAPTPDPAVIAVGTTTYGGSGTKTEMRPARLVFWDWKRRTTVSELTPWEDEIVIGSLLRLGDELFICGAPKGKMAVYDFKTNKIVHNEDWGYGTGRLRLRPEDGKIYSFMGGRLVRMDPALRRPEVLATYPGLGTQIAVSGPFVYGITDTHLVRFKLE